MLVKMHKRLRQVGASCKDPSYTLYVVRFRTRERQILAVVGTTNRRIANRLLLLRHIQKAENEVESMSNITERASPSCTIADGPNSSCSAKKYINYNFEPMPRSYHFVSVLCIPGTIL